MAATSADLRSVADIREHPTIRWGAVWAGWFVATGMALGLYTFGLAIGFSAINPNDATAVSRGISAGTIVWLILTWGASLWTGAMFASWFDGRNDTEMGVIRGLTVWGLSVAAAGLLLTRGLARVGSAAANTGSADATIDPTVLAHYLAAAMWTAFGCIVLSLLASALGGWLGARHVHHVYHLRQYTPHGR
jgi:hypothetical protein